MLAEAFDVQNEFHMVSRIMAPDHVIAQLGGRFAKYTCMAEVPNNRQAGAEAATWASSRVWQWWPSPDVRVAQGYTIPKPRLVTIWTVLHAACRAAEKEALPDLEPELWLLIFTFLKAA